MKRVYIFIAAMFIATLGMAQNAPIDFEQGGYGKDWTWNVFENNTNPALEFVANPDKSGINTSDNVAKFTALQTGQPWAGTESVRDAAFLGHFVLDATNSTIKIKVHKPVISDVGIKLVSDSGWALPEIKVANTLTNQWEELTFDFSAYSNPPADKGKYVQIIIFPDFNARTQDNICYFDDITFSAAQAPPAPTASAPTPTLAASDVISIFSDAYNDVSGTDFYPNWGQSTVVTYPDIAGDSMLKYLNFNFQGTTFAAPVDASGMDHIHLDMWTADATTVNFFCVSSGPTEKGYSLAVKQNEWVSYDIPLAAFTGVDMKDLIQLKFDGGSGAQTIFLDNIYFYIAPPTGPTVAAPTPTVDEKMVISVFSDEYTNEAGTDFNPAWGQATVVTYPEIVAGDTALKYANFNFQGTTFGSAIDASKMEYLHLDMWTADASTVNVFCVSSGPTEKSYALTVKANEWVSYDIPLTDFTGVDMADLIQFKFDGGTGTETIFLDNLFFYTKTSSIEKTISNDNQLSIYPNPVISGQKVFLNANVRLYQVYDNTGRNIMSGATQELSTGSFVPGQYFIVVETLNGTIETQKLIVK